MRCWYSEICYPNLDAQSEPEQSYESESARFSISVDIGPGGVPDKSPFANGCNRHKQLALQFSGNSYLKRKRAHLHAIPLQVSGSLQSGKGRQHLYCWIWERCVVQVGGDNRTVSL